MTRQAAGLCCELIGPEQCKCNRMSMFDETTAFG